MKTYVTGCCFIIYFYGLVCGIIYGPYKNCVLAKNTLFWDVMSCRIINIC